MLIVYGFYTKWNGSSKTTIDMLEKRINLSKVRFHKVCVEDDKALWEKYDLKTVPGVVITNCSETVGFFAGNLNLDKIKDEIEQIQNNQSSENIFYKLTEGWIVDSSSCHRYDRWNEQYLFINNVQNGWSSVSSKICDTAFLVFDLLKEQRIAQLKLKPRNWGLNKDLINSFPDEVHVYFSDNGMDWKKDTRCLIDKEKASDVLISLSGNRTRYIRIEFKVYNKRKDGKYFIQLSQICVYGQIEKDENRAKISMLPSFFKLNKESRYNTETANKCGLMYGNSTSCESWFLLPKQKVPQRVFYESNVLIIPLDGDLAICYGNKAEKRTLCNGEAVIIPKNCLHSVENQSESKVCYIEMRDSSPSICTWSVRDE